MLTVTVGALASRACAGAREQPDRTGQAAAKRTAAKQACQHDSRPRKNTPVVPIIRLLIDYAPKCHFLFYSRELAGKERGKPWADLSAPLDGPLSGPEFEPSKVLLPIDLATRNRVVQPLEPLFVNARLPKV